MALCGGNIRDSDIWLINDPHTLSKRNDMSVPATQERISSPPLLTDDEPHAKLEVKEEDLERGPNPPGASSASPGTVEPVPSSTYNSPEQLPDGQEEEKAYACDRVKHEIDDNCSETSALYGINDSRLLTASQSFVDDRAAPPTQEFDFESMANSAVDNYAHCMSGDPCSADDSFTAWLENEAAYIRCVSASSGCD